MLILPIKRKWFDMIKSGEKKEEYRELKPYWKSRFDNMMNADFKITNKGVTFLITFRNGYQLESPTLICRCILREGQGKQEWGAEPNKEYYILEILEILEVQNVK